MSSVAHFPTVPSTPQKRDEVGDKLVQQLNQDYNLGVSSVLADSTLTPSRRKELARQNEAYGREDRIRNSLRFLHYKSNGDLEKALDMFYYEAKAASQLWVPKPRADPTTLPSADFPKAYTPGQQLQFQTLLVETLDKYRSLTAPSTPSGLFNRLTVTSPIVNAPPGPSRSGLGSSAAFPDMKDTKGPASPRTKRRSLEEDAAQATKRPRGKETVSHVSANAFDHVPGRQRLGQDNFLPWDRASDEDTDEVEVVAVRRRPDSSSSHSSKQSFVSVFSHVEHSPKATQSTVVAASQPASSYKKHLTAQAGSQGSQYDDSLAPSSGTQRVLEKSFAYVQNQLPIQPSTVSVARPSTQQKITRIASSPSNVFSNFSDNEDDIPLPDELEELVVRRQLTPLNQQRLSPIEERLQNIWPKFPRWLHNAPLAVTWEVTRICLHCGVDLEHQSLKYNPAWAKGTMADIWKSLWQLDVFRDKAFPSKPTAEAFSAALTNFESKGNAVILTANLDFNPSKEGPLLLLDMKPLRIEQGCRLTRRFGPDRFFEVLMPSPTAMNAPEIVKARGGSEAVIKWLTQQQHSFVGRQWQAFYTKDAGYRTPPKDFRLGPVKPIFKDRVHFFAESGHNFRSPPPRSNFTPAEESVSQRRDIKVSQMLDWLLQLKHNVQQPHLKLFSRIQLGLSKTLPVFTFEPEQITHHPQDILSPIGKVMNDGIGRMSRNVAKRIRDAFGLIDVPSAVQGRMGSAKGMWLMDVSDTSGEDWIETYPSQRKWICDFADPMQRTLEVRSVASELKSAGLNLQFLPVLEDRAKDKALMREAIGTRLTNDLRRQFDIQKAAFKRPIQFRQWVHENWNNRTGRVKSGHVPFLGGLPDGKEETLKFLINSGFDPKKQKFLQEMAWDLQKQKCDMLKTKMNIKVGRSAYIYMVIDFLGVLEENEVHVGFSNRFRDESNETSYTLLADCDVLVARSPAHFVSDVQKVKAVFKSELHALKDVIVFSSKGNVPLADKLSGGDYDGDVAWVCWDPDIVSSFMNADVPAQPDFSGYMTKDKTTFEDLVKRANAQGKTRVREPILDAVYDMISKSFQFAMQPNLLGICTNFKEKLCYHNNSVSNEAAVILSSLVGNLVDQSKQGIIFNLASWDRLRRDKFGSFRPEDPAYQGDIWAGKSDPVHIIDYLKFKIAKPAIDQELKEFHKAMQTDKSRAAIGEDDAAHHWDPDLTSFYEGTKALRSSSRSWNAILDSLKNAIGEVEREWKKIMGNRDSDMEFPDKVKFIHAKWHEIRPQAISHSGSNKLDPKVIGLLEQPWLADPSEASLWALLKASTAFKMFYKTSPKFVWQMAGRQLAFIKAQTIHGDGVPVLTSPLMYAGLNPDGRFVKQYVALLDGNGSDYPDPDDGDGGDGDRAGWGFGGFDDY
ncbi:RNA dependent RNA polymerase-domain-containing protein [Podospora didyma]|uniref:RNA-dependent RNA polymerase n=1 Tax=Podospora didyma TaxID=330526 RepID=A0AAE0K2Y6_9PEZI|nr:RNA dependent RNA polymerase-domain-containing protein [Podospora didyma]